MVQGNMQFAPQPMYGAPQQQYGAPQQMPQYAPQQVVAPQVQYGAPPQQPQMQYAAPAPQQVQYAAPQPQVFQAPAPQVQYAAPAPQAMQPGVTYQQNPEGAEMLQVTVFGTKQLTGAFVPQVDIAIDGKPHKHTIESAAIEGPHMTPKSLITYYIPGEHLNFSVSEGGSLLGDVQISGQDFHPNGLEGDLPLMDPTTGAQGVGYLMVRIVPLGVSGQAVDLAPVEIKGEPQMAPDPAPYVAGQSAPRFVSPEEFQQLSAQGAMLMTQEDQRFQQPVMSQPAPMPQPVAYAAPQPQPMFAAPQAQPQPMYAQPQPMPTQQPMYAQPMPTQAPGVFQPQQQQPGFSMPFPGSAARP